MKMHIAQKILENSQLVVFVQTSAAIPLTKYEKVVEQEVKAEPILGQQETFAASFIHNRHVGLMLWHHWDANLLEK